MQYREEDYKPEDVAEEVSETVKKDTEEGGAADTEKDEPTEENGIVRDKKAGKNNPALKKLLSAVEWLLLVASFGLVVYAFVCTARGKAVTVAGYSLLHVITGSMEPTISVGDYVIVKHLNRNARINLYGNFLTAKVC